jgi:thiol-disulfide isomerase/thioredoxin
MNLGASSSDDSSILSKLNMSGGAFSMKTIIYILSAILFIGLAIFIYYKYVAPKLKPAYMPNREKINSDNNEQATNQAELLFFYVDWCPHCKTAKPVWDELEKEYENKTINGYRIMFNKINCTNESDEIENLMNKYKIEGYPTIKLLKDNQVIEYDAKPTKETLEQFLNTVL